MNLLQWLLLPITATAALSPAPPSVPHVLLLGEEAPYVQDYPVVNQDALQALSLQETANVPPTSTTTLISEYMPPEMMPVLKCESHFRQWGSDNKILTSSTGDVGIAQISVKTWGAKAKELGYDIYQTEGNLQMAKYVLDIQGKTAWVCYNLAVNS